MSKQMRFGKLNSSRSQWVKIFSCVNSALYVCGGLRKYVKHYLKINFVLLCLNNFSFALQFITAGAKLIETIRCTISANF